MFGRRSQIHPTILATALMLGCVTTVAEAQRYQVLPPKSQRKTVFPAQPAARSGVRGVAKDSKTIVDVELITGKNGGALQAQRWLPVFEQMGVDVRIRQAIFKDKPEIRENQVGPLRRVKVIGKLERTGAIVFPGKSFTRSDAAKLSEWLRDLQTFGKQGNPAGQPMWGLNKTQFSEVYESLSKKVGGDAKGKSLREGVEALGLPKKYPVRFSTSATAWLRSEYSSDKTYPQSLEAFTQGTALAMLLNDFGLGFQPSRTPEGSVEILVESIRSTTKVWPVGWELKQSRQKTAPKLFQMIPVELDNVALMDVLNAISVKTTVPVRFDRYRIEGHGIDIDKLHVSYPERKTSWNLLLRGVTNPNRLAHHLKIDERGQPFIWVTTLKLGRLGREP